MAFLAQSIKANITFSNEEHSAVSLIYDDKEKEDASHQAADFIRAYANKLRKLEDDL